MRCYRDFSDNIHNFGEQKAFLRFKEYWDNECQEMDLICGRNEAAISG